MPPPAPAPEAVLDRFARPGRVQDFARTTWQAICDDRAHAGPILSRARRDARHLHSRERRLASDALYDLIRFEQLLGASPWDAWLAWRRGELDLAGVAASRAAELPPDEAVAVLGNLPLGPASELRRSLGEAVWAYLGASNQRAPTVLRAQGVSAQALVDELAAEGIAARVAERAPQGVELLQGANIVALRAHREGRCELQDEASQLVCGLIERGPVLDLCAGAGGKSLALAARGLEVIAADVRGHALQEARKRARRAGLALRTHVLRDGPLPVELTGMASVLVDAPCTGLGVLRRHPENRFRAERAAQLPELQRTLLHRALDAVRPGGRVVYATCSVLDAENREVVEAVLAERDDAEATGEGLALTPHEHGTDGFFATVLVRAGSAAR